jgi:regulator of protease activity HflC (stomatin/prohibitin superfamily)
MASARVPPPDSTNPALRLRPGGPRPALLVAAGVVVLLLVAWPLYWWFIQRVEVPANHVLILVRKVGAELPPSEVAASQVVLYPELLASLGEPPESHRFKGVLFEPRVEGRYFYDPFLWERIIVPAVQIRDDEIGVLMRRYGRVLPAGKVLATAPDERGPLAEILKPGRYNINPFADEVRRIRPVILPPGYVGLQTLYAGEAPENPNTYTVAEADAQKRGVQPDVLPPGMYYNNPYARRIDVIDVRSHTIDLHGDEALRFPSNDSFEIIVDCTVEYAVRQDMAPYVMVAIGDHDEVKEKLILPYARSFCRIEGSKMFARDFISGETRTAFQKRVFDGLREQCYAQGIEIRAALIRRIVPPAEIAGPISDRQLAGQQIKQYENEIKLAQSEAKLVEQQELQKQNQALGDANRDVVTVTKEAEQNKSVAVTQAKQRLEVAKLNLAAAAATAAATVSRGEAEAEVVRLTFEAQTTPLREAVASFGDGETYAQFYFYQKLGPALKSVLASTDGPFAEIFKSLTRSAQPASPRSGGPARPASADGERAAAAAAGAAEPSNPSDRGDRE